MLVCYAQNHIYSDNNKYNHCHPIFTVHYLKQTTTDAKITGIWNNIPIPPLIYSASNIGKGVVYTMVELVVGTVKFVEAIIVLVDTITLVGT